MEVAPEDGSVAEFPERGFVFKLNHFFVPEKYHEGMKTLVSNTYAEVAVVVVILVNTLLLVIYNPNKLQSTSDDTKTTLEWVDFTFTLFYTFEAVWRMMCFGLFDVGKEQEKTPEEEEVNTNKQSNKADKVAEHEPSGSSVHPCPCMPCFAVPLLCMLDDK